MANLINRLSSLDVQRLGPGKHLDGRGLYLQVTEGGRSWLFRFSHSTKKGQTRWMGLGPAVDVSLAEAREAARECRHMVRNGTDPIETRRARKNAAKIEAAKSITFKDCAEQYIAAHKPGWSNAKHATQWRTSIETYAYPLLGNLPVQAIDTALVMKALSAIWTEKPETAARVRQRIEAVLGYATAHEWRRGDNPARWRGHLDNLLPQKSKVRAVKHFPSLPHAEISEFFQELRTRDTVSAKALSFAILTAARSGEVRGAACEEIDRTAKIWTVPGSRMKSGSEHRIPLAPEAMAIVNEMWPATGRGFLFPNETGRKLSEATMLRYLQRNMERPDLTVHGFRSSFRVWATGKGRFPRSLAEGALAHTIKDKTESAYVRDGGEQDEDMIEQRREMMTAWGRYCGFAEERGTVVPITSRAS